MNWFKKNPLFSTTLLILFILIIGQVALLFMQYGKLTDSRQSLESLSTERDRLLQREPAPIPENAETIREELEAYENLLSSVKDLFADPESLSDFFGTFPADNSQALFDISTWRTETLGKFTQAGMISNPAEINLGFQRHASTVRREEPIEKIHRQRVIVDYLLGHLFEANPERLRRVSRQDPQRDQAEERTDTRFRRPAPTTGRTEGDFFEMPPLLTLRQANAIESEGFRISFTGQTSSLRRFLDSLQNSQLPLFVRNVEVRPLEGQRRARARIDETEELLQIISRFEEEGGPTGGGELDVSVLEELGTEERERLRPIIGTVINEFIVTVEFVTLTEDPNLEEISNF